MKKVVREKISFTKLENFPNFYITQAISLPEENYFLYCEGGYYFIWNFLQNLVVHQSIIESNLEFHYFFDYILLEVDRNQ
jgi:hypothetical protein